MRISDILKTNKVTVSCEMFPPKPGKPLENTQQVVHEIAAYKPSFMSVTYGAGGSNSKNTLSIAEEVQKSGVTALAHLTCVGQDEENLRASINASVSYTHLDVYKRQVYAGGQTGNCETPLCVMPVFVREGAELDWTLLKRR